LRTRKDLSDAEVKERIQSTNNGKEKQTEMIAYENLKAKLNSKYST